MKQKLFVCKNAWKHDGCQACSNSRPTPQRYGYLSWQCSWHEMIRHRHPLEVALVREIARLRKTRKFRFSGDRLTTTTLWRVLKEGRE
jgi:hypothetical protein